jgi:hypothetical protein
MLIMVFALLICITPGVCNADVIFKVEGTVNQGVLSRDAICQNYGYQETIQDGDGSIVPNPESKGSFAKRVILSFIKDNIRAYKTSEAEIIRLQKAQEADADSYGIIVN